MPKPVDVGHDSRMNLETETAIPRARALRAIQTRDARQAGRFVYGVKTTGIFCHPWCPARRALPENIDLFATPLEAERAGFRACKRCFERAASNPAVERARAVIAARAVDGGVRLDDLAGIVGLSQFHLQRLFRKRFGVSPKEYAQALRDQAWRRGLRRGNSVTEAMLDAGFSSTSRAHHASQLGVTPSLYRRGAPGETISYAIATSPLGRMLVACSPRGICRVAFGDGDTPLGRLLADEYPKAVLLRDEAGLRTVVHEVIAAMRGSEGATTLPLDVAGTVFQQRVWRALREIPRGATRTYGQIAAALKRPKAARAVANACARNRIAIVIPCHRVVRGDGGLGGYRWGVKRKAKLLQAETGRPGRRPLGAGERT
jgi:AraC family transcriptional regulator of adaptative response/methylated-DNA-[protein]-cysteine methyltransferase